MAYERKENTGAIFTDQTYEAEGKYGTPSKYHTGNALINGKSYNIRAYLTTSKSGIAYLKLTFKQQSE